MPPPPSSAKPQSIADAPLIRPVSLVVTVTLSKLNSDASSDGADASEGCLLLRPWCLDDDAVDGGRRRGLSSGDDEDHPPPASLSAVMLLLLAVVAVVYPSLEASHRCCS